MGRTYDAGRSTEGWAKGKRLFGLPKAGDVLIMVSHQFGAENLIKVTRSGEPPTPRGFYYEYVTPEGVPTPPPDNVCGMFKHDFEYGKRGETAMYRAIKEKK